MNQEVLRGLQISVREMEDGRFLLLASRSFGEDERKYACAFALDDQQAALVRKVLEQKCAPI